MRSRTSRSRAAPSSPSQIVALARIKRAAALANEELGILEQAIADAIVAAADEIIAGEYDDQFPIDVYQTGSGTSSNMNMNEVLATLASDVARHARAPERPRQRVAVVERRVPDLGAHRRHRRAHRTTSSRRWTTSRSRSRRRPTSGRAVVKSGRTHLMDATPVTLGQEFGGYARQIRLGIERVQATLPRVAEVPLGGTAVGTGINTPTGFPQRVIALLAEETGLPITEAKDHFEAQAHRDGLVEASGALRTIAVSLTKICNDLRWMGSGPNTGLGEITSPTCSRARRSCRAR